MTEATRARIREAYTREGRAMSLRRRVGTTNTFLDVTVTGTSRHYEPEELVGGIAQGDRQVVLINDEIEAAGWPGPPRRGDILVIDGATTTIQGGSTSRRRNLILGHILWVRG